MTGASPVQAEPFVSIIILNYNGRDHLPDCLASVTRIDYPSDRLEILLTDNGSADGSPAWVRAQFPRVRVMELGQNLGFAEGNNRGASAARGEVLVFLNTDTRVERGWLRALIAPLAGPDRSVVATASKLLDWEGRALDFPVYATLMGMPHSSREARSFRRPGDYDKVQDLLFASGGAMAITAAAFADVGGFDADYFMYHEDVDLGWRLWLRGYKVRYVPTAIAYHRLGGSQSTDPTGWLYFLNERNALFTVIKNVGDAWLARLLPLLLLWLFERAGRYLGIDPSVYEPTGPGPVMPPKAIPKGTLAALAAAMDVTHHLPRLLEKRAEIQARRVRSDEEIATLLDLPREVFVQMILAADIDFREATRLLDGLGFSLGDTSLVGERLRRVRAVTDERSTDAWQVLDCLLYMADHSPSEAEAEFGPEVVASLIRDSGIAARDLPVLARVLAVAGSKLLAGFGTRSGRDGSADQMLALMREVLWRDVVFYREELSKRTDQLIRTLRETKERLSNPPSRRPPSEAEREAVRDSLERVEREALRSSMVEDREALAAKLVMARESQEHLAREVERLRSELALREAEVSGSQERETAWAETFAAREAEWRARESEWDAQRAAWQTSQAQWEIERSGHKAELAAAWAGRDRARTVLQAVLQSRRYRFGNLLAIALWLAIHPGYVLARMKEGTWQWARGILPYGTKLWVKRVVLRQPVDLWGPPVYTRPPGSTRVALPEALSAGRATVGLVADPAAASVRTPLQPHHDVIVFAVIDWGFRFQRPQQLAAQFADHGHRVFYVSVTFDQVRLSDGDAPAARLTTLRPHVHEVRLAGPVGLNVYRSRLDGDLLDRWTAAFEPLKADQGIIDAVCLVQLPFWRPLAARLRQAFGWKLVYDCLDRHSGFSTNDPAMLVEEEGLTRESDLVVATSRALLEEHRTQNPRCIRVPNGTDFDHFSVFVGEAPAWLQQLPRPVVGYYGAIAEWFDTALVAELARRHPRWSFVLAGSTYTADLKPLERLSNVYLVGEQPYQVLPVFLHSFDACIIPFKRNPLTEATNPVKFYEYLSAGKPVISVRLPELEPYVSEGLVALANDAPEFSEQIECALAVDSPALVARRRQFAAQHTWRARFVQLRDAILDLYPKASIIVPTHNNLHLTRLCLDGIFRNTSWPNYEITVVDNASSDETPAYLQDLCARHPHTHCILNERNEGFARANNQGSAAANGEYLVLLNNDTIVTRGWLTTMIHYLAAHPDVGMIGPATNLAGNEAKINVDYASLKEMEAFAERYTREHAGMAIEPKMLGFFCVVIPRRVIDQVGLLDERFGIGMFEDDDFSHRVREAGYRLVCTDGAFVHHFHSATMRRFSEAEYVQMFETNRQKFETKWNVRWTPHRYRWQR